MATKSQLDIIKKFMRSLDTTNTSGKSALNQAVKYSTGGYFSNISSAINKMIADCIEQHGHGRNHGQRRGRLKN